MTASSTRAGAVPPRSVADLTFDQPMPRKMVHKTGHGEVFVTDSVQLSPELIVLAGELPRSHAFFSDGGATPPGVELLAAVEMARQAAYVVGARYLGVAADDKYVLRNVHGSLTPYARTVPQGRPTTVIINFRLASVFQRDGAPCGVRAELEMVACDGPTLGTFGLSYSWMPAAQWHAFRATAPPGSGELPPPRTVRPPALVDAPAVGRSNPANVLLASPVTSDAPPATPDPLEDAVALTASRGELLPDPHYAPLFDHPGDHVSGMALLEGWRQLALWAAAGRLGCAAAEVAVEQLDATFTSVAEFQGQITCEATLGQPVAGFVVAHVTGEQEGRPLGHTRVAMRLPRGG